jgi:hypothetical protein
MCQAIKVSGYVSGTEFASFYVFLRLDISKVLIVWYFFIFQFILDIFNHQSTTPLSPSQLIRV